MGRWEAAVDWWGQAIDCATTLGARPELGRTLMDAGHALADSPAGSTLRGMDADNCLQEARKIFEDLELAEDLTRLFPESR